ncbi:hypothetical protein AAON49_12105 [Pseudotenacibaculum sp. MALMAid0570]|uniref:hypothetical protein n=1 Tax=Pseudotenacibaculum sp. MALMAid0570 TaxID=3143938 RepID=UPI0032DEE263
MEKHERYTDEVFEQKFRDCKFPPLYFSHEAHLRLAYIHLKKYGLDQSIQNMCQQIYDFAIKYGATMKFNATVTYASLQIMYHYMQEGKSENFSDLMKEFPHLLQDFKTEIKIYYSWDVFRSPEAKAKIHNPDLKPFAHAATID